MWRWLWSRHHGVILNERPHCLKLFRDLLYSKSEEEFIEKRETLENDPIIDKNITYKNHLVNAYFSRIEKWALFVRNQEEMETHNMNTNNMTETTFKIFKEFILHRRKCYNLPDLVQVILKTGTNFYRLKLTDIGNNRGIVYQSRYEAKDITIQREQICQIDEDQYRVESESVKDTFYFVNMKTGFCECRQGRNCGPCKHKFAIHHHFGVSGISCLPQLDSKSRAKWHYIATGQQVDASWFRGLRDTDTATQETQNDMNDDDDVNINEDNQDDMNDDVRIDVHEQDDMNNDADAVIMNEDEQNVDEMRNENDRAAAADDNDDDNMNGEWNRDKETFESINKQFMVTAEQAYMAKDEAFIKAIRNYYKRLKNTMLNRRILTNNLITFGQQTDDSVVPGRKRKHTTDIHVQPSSQQRRGKKGGKGPSTPGRQPKAGPSSQSSVDMDDEQRVFQSLPPPKKKKIAKKVHSLKVAVEANQSAVRKH